LIINVQGILIDFRSLCLLLLSSKTFMTIDPINCFLTSVMPRLEAAASITANKELPETAHFCRQFQ